jgi:hypothetical protein
MPAHPTYSLLTKVLDSRHVLILQDWLEFMTEAPVDMAIYIREDPEIRRRIDQLASASGVPWTALAAQPADDLWNDETTVLRRLAQDTRGDYLLMVNLDTLPFRDGPAEEHWLQEIFARLREGNFAFLTGDGVRFRDDQEQAPGFFRTRHFSNNFGLIERAFWYAAMDRHPPTSKGEAARRFHSEWAIGDELRRHDRFGLRRLDGWSWRVFHVQQWDERLFATRALFRRGVGIAPFLNRFYEDYRHPWQWHFNYPVPSLLKRLRIRLGAWRRGLD